MKKFCLCLITLNICCFASQAQNCNNWLNTPSLNSTVSIGDLDVPGDQITVEATINRTHSYTQDAADFTEGDVVSKHNGPEDVNYLLRPNDASITTTNGFFIAQAPCNIELNKTYHVAMVYDGATLKFYRNGFLMSQVSATGNLYQNNWNTKFGLYDPSFWPSEFIGYINEVRIWNVARTQSQLNAFMNVSLPNPTTQPGLLAYYIFDNLKNKQGNSIYDGILTGIASVSQLNPNCAFIADSCAKTATTQGIGNIINSYTPVIALNPCDNKITVEDASTFNIGDTVLIIQMKGAVIDSSNTPSFGDISDYKSAGNYEFNYVKSKAGNIIELADTLLRNYDIPTSKVQLIRVPYYNTANISSTLTCLPWDGAKGGVLVLNAKDSVNLNADIDVSGQGFSGGNSPNSGATVLTCFNNDYSYPKGSITAAAKGEGIAIIGDNIAWGKGPSANGGGSGLGHNSGGGGGSNGGAGGFGGYQLINCGSAPFDNRGIGAKPVIYNNIQNKVFMGGGGGSGHVDNFDGTDMNGGQGGGIIIINTKVITSNGFNILAKGGDAPECSNALHNCGDGSGGGGAGGSILIKNNTYINPAQLNVSGGKGADLVIYDGNLAPKIGPGGGGGAGIIWVNQITLPPAVIVTSNGGINGVILQNNNDPWGTTPGEAGINLFNLQLPNDTIPFRKNIDSVRLRDSAITCNTFGFKGIAYTVRNPVAQWQWNFGDSTTAATQNTAHSYLKAGTYTVSLIITDINGCMDSVKTTVTTAGAGIDFSYKQDVCNPLSVQFFSIGATPVSPAWLFGDGASVTANPGPAHTYATPGTYAVKYSVQNGSCTDSVTKNILISFLKDDIILTHDTTICFGTAKQLLTKSSLSFCWSPVTYLDDPASANPTTSTPVPITYYFTAEVPGTNLIANGDFSAGNTGFTSQYAFANPNVTEGQYFVGNNVQSWNALMSNCGDHTTGTGNMLLVNGASVADVNVWSQAVSVVPNTNYAFSTWIQSLYPPNPAQLSFSINGSDIGSTITATLPNCNWTQFYTTWNSGNNTTASIAIVNKNTFVQGNDFALDDISFSPVLIKRDSVIISIDKPVVKAGNDTLVCAGNTVQLTATGTPAFNWSPAAGLNNATIGNPLATAVSNTQYVVTGTSAKGCNATDTVVITTKALPVITKTADSIICRNISAQLWATGGTAYQWSPAGSLNNATIFNPVATPGVNTLYHVVVTGSNNCTAADSVNISLRDAAIFAVSPPDTTCFNTAVQLSASGGDSYLWSPASSVTNAGIANPLSAGNADAAYTVLIKENTCNTSATLHTSLKVLPVPVVKATKSNDIDCSINAAQLSATGATIYSWSPAIALDNNAIANPVASPSATTQYVVTGTDLVTNCTATGNVTVIVSKGGEPKFFIPSAFSPNGDGKNDCFKVTHFNYLKSVEISIFNRFGNLVFHTTTDNDCWDGTYKGAPQNPGNYVYYIRTENNCEVFFKKGNLVLVR